MTVSKQALDTLLSLCSLTVCAPLMVLIALIIKMDSRGPVFYTQARVGINRRRGHRGKAISSVGAEEDRRRQSNHGAVFHIIKFRSMRVDSEPDGRPIWCRVNDPRVTRMGKLLRKTHLDELPQLFNILKGEMSFVGPRPERPEIMSPLCESVRGYSHRLIVKPGLTGLAQIRHRADLHTGDVRKKVRYDLLYIRSWSLAADLMIMAGTVPMVLGITPDKLRRLRKLPRSLKAGGASLGNRLSRNRPWLAPVRRFRSLLTMMW